MIIPLSGSGELIIEGRNSFAVYPGCVLYNPPHTRHDVVNTGDQPLRYIFIVSRA
jgi:mannose-6-phosphate isomerase-like protein (cupin superfamily)